MNAIVKNVNDVYRAVMLLNKLTLLHYSMLLVQLIIIINHVGSFIAHISVLDRSMPLTIN